MHTKGEWIWQFDPLNPDKIEIVQDGQAIFLTQSFDNAKRLCQILNSYEDMYEALKAVLASVVCNDDMSISYAIDGLTRCQIDNALSKAGGK